MSRKKEKYKLFKNTLNGIVSNSYGNVIGGIDISIQSDKNVYVDGCIGIDEFNGDKVVFLGKRMKVIVSGCDIELYTFENGCIRASGTIFNVEIIREGEND